MPNSFLGSTISGKRRCQVVVRFLVGGVDPERLGILRDCFIELALRDQRIPQVVVRLGKVGRNADRLIIAIASSSLPCLASTLPRLLCASA